jgi:hypothetical protein
MRGICFKIIRNFVCSRGKVNCLKDTISEGAKKDTIKKRQIVSIKYHIWVISEESEEGSNRYLRKLTTYAIQNIVLYIRRQIVSIKYHIWVV